MNDDYDFEDERAEMVEQLRAYGIEDERILCAMGRIRRHMFIPEDYRWTCEPYGDHPCRIGGGQTISQPYIVAYMTELLALKEGEKVLEIGCGSGYQSAVLASLGAEVVSMEIRPELADHASFVLSAEGFENVRVVCVDGHAGVPDGGPYDAVIGTCAAEEVPEVVGASLKEGGRFVLPVGGASQRLIKGKKLHGALVKEKDLAVVFVPMVGEEKPET